MNLKNYQITLKPVYNVAQTRPDDSYHRIVSLAAPLRQRAPIHGKFAWWQPAGCVAGRSFPNGGLLRPPIAARLRCHPMKSTLPLPIAISGPRQKTMSSSSPPRRSSCILFMAPIIQFQTISACWKCRSCQRWSQNHAMVAMPPFVCPELTIR